MRKRFCNGIEEQETLKRQIRKIETEKINKVNKVKQHRIRIELIKYTTKREIEDLLTERVDKLNQIEAVKTEAETEIYNQINKNSQEQIYSLLPWITIYLC